ncbi:MAG TPA: NAD-dependent epimerase/dehydratase family protein [Thermoanaerobaculia bacterium]|nr:NAD-dependent epimerase/dehydratase family protein [Thermoanaerobaculia bacterium]
MHVLVTGATGYIGHAVVAELTAAGHEVTGLVRSDEKAAAVRALGARAAVADLKEPQSYRALAAEHDALIHTAFESSRQGVAADRTAVETLLAASDASGAAGAGRMKSLVYTSGIWVLGAAGDSPAFEDAPTDRAAALVAWRPAHERLVLEAGTAQLATAVVRPGIVWGGRGGLTASYFETAEREGAAAFVGDGSNRVAMIHVGDLARFFRLLVEQQGRGIFHAVDGAAVRLAELARAASEAAGAQGRTRSIPLAAARQEMGPFADALALDQVVASRRGVELGWRPLHPSFVAAAAEAYREWKSSRAGVSRAG